MSFSRNNYSVLSLFSGAGGLDLGFEAAGFRLLEAIDINPWCIQTLQKNRPNWQVILGDVRDYYPEKQPVYRCGHRPRCAQLHFNCCPGKVHF